MKVGRYIFSVAERELQAENDELRQEIQAISAECDKFAKLYYDLLYARTSSYHASSSQTAAPTIGLKNYLRPTESSTRRQAIRTPQPPTKKKNLDTFDHTQEESTSELDNHELLSEAVSTPAQIECNERGFYCRSDDSDGWGCAAAQLPCSCVLCTDFKLEYHLGERNDLCRQTRLDDASFYQTPTGRAYVRFNKVLKILHAAHRLARDSLWHALRDYWPDFQQRYYKFGPFQVRFGRTELGDIFQKEFICGRSRAPECKAICDMPPRTVNNAIMAVITLRNALTHPSILTPKAADELTRYAQQLACVLRDEDRARQLRKLRDRLIDLVMEEHKEVVTYAPLSCLPNGRHWPLHTQCFLEEVTHYIRRYPEHLETKKNSQPWRVVIAPENFYRPAIVQAAVTWIARFQEPGDDLLHRRYIRMPISSKIVVGSRQILPEATQEAIRMVQVPLPPPKLTAETGVDLRGLFKEF